MKDYTEKVTKLNAIADKLDSLSGGMEGEAAQLAKQLSDRARSGAAQMRASMIGPPSEAKGTVADVMAGKANPFPSASLPQMQLQPNEIVSNVTGEPVRVMSDEEVAAQELALGEEGRTPAMRNFAQGLTLGWADEMEAAYKAAGSDRTYEEVLDEIRMKRREDNAKLGGEAIVQELAGAAIVPTPIKAPVKSATLKGAIEGAVLGGVYGAGTAEGDTLAGAAKGATVGGVFGGIATKTLNSVIPLAQKSKNFKLFATAKKVNGNPTVANLKELRDAAYKGVNMDNKLLGANDVWNLRMDFAKVAKEFDYFPEKAGKTVVDKALTMINSKGTRTVGEYEALRKGLGTLANDPTYGTIIKGMLNKLDDVAEARIAASGDDALLAARESHKAYAKAKMFDEAFDSARISGLSGKSDPYTLYRGAAEKVLKSKDAKYLTPDERQVVEAFIAAPMPDRVMSKMAALAPSSANFWAMMHLAGAVSTANPFLITSIVATEGAKVLKDKRVVSQAQELIEKLGGMEAFQKLSANPAASIGGIMSFDTVMDMYFPDTEPLKVEVTK